MNTIKFVIVVSMVLLVSSNLQFIGYGQNTSSSAVDKLIEDAKKDITIQPEYRAELIKRLVNSTCYSMYDTFPNKTFIIDQMETWKLEDSLKQCVAAGGIK